MIQAKQTFYNILNRNKINSGIIMIEKNNSILIIGTTPEEDDVLPWHKTTRHGRFYIPELDLKQGETYFLSVAGNVNIWSKILVYIFKLKKNITIF